MENREDEMNAAWVVEKRGDNEVPCEKNGEWGENEAEMNSAVRKAGDGGHAVCTMKDGSMM